MKVAPVSTVVVPLLGAAVALALHRRVGVQRGISLLATLASTVFAVAMLVTTYRQGPLVVDLGGWPAPLGIVLVVDLLSALLLCIATTTVFGVLVYAIAQLPDIVESRYFHPLYLVLTAGVCLALLTGDIFNLFVAFEVMLIASYALMTLAGGSVQIRPALTYVVVNLLASTLFLTSVALVYASLGTVNMADISSKAVALDPSLRQALALLFLVVFGIKSAIFPLFFWLPDSYPAAPTAITAIFAGLLTKVGVYAMLRLDTVVFGQEAIPRPLFLGLAAATMVVGVLGALAQDDIKRILSFHIVSQIGYMILGIGMATVAGVAGVILFMVHQIPVKTALFLIGGIVEKTTGTGALHRLGGLAKKMPFLGVLFMLAALSLAGIPPLSGFFGKLALVQAGIATRDAFVYVTTGVSLVVSLLTLTSMVKIWAGAFWGEPDEPPPFEKKFSMERIPLPKLMTFSTAAMVAVTLAIALWVEPIYGLSTRAAESLLDSSEYVKVVMHR